MPISFVGPLCARRGCTRPEFRSGLCARCWRLARFVGRDPALFAYEPMHAYTDERDAVELPWGRWEQEAQARGLAVADYLAELPRPEPDQP